MKILTANAALNCVIASAATLCAKWSHDRLVDDGNRATHWPLDGGDSEVGLWLDPWASCVCKSDSILWFIAFTATQSHFPSLIKSVTRYRSLTVIRLTTYYNVFISLCPNAPIELWCVGLTGTNLLHINLGQMEQLIRVGRIINFYQNFLLSAAAAGHIVAASLPNAHTSPL